MSAATSYVGLTSLCAHNGNKCVANRLNEWTVEIKSRSNQAYSLQNESQTENITATFFFLFFFLHITATSNKPSNKHQVGLAWQLSDLHLYRNLARRSFMCANFSSKHQRSMTDWADTLAPKCAPISAACNSKWSLQGYAVNIRRNAGNARNIKLEWY